MTREEAINYFKRSFAIGEGDDEKYHNEVLEYTIKNLEQQEVLFKNGLLKDCESCKALEQQPWSLDDAREDFMHDVYNTLDFLPTNEEANRIIDSFDRVTKCIEQQPCENCISRQAAIEVAKQYWYKPDIAGALAELPPVQQKMGHWIDINNHHYYNDGDIETTELRCSCCNEVVEWDIESLHKPYYCENCGCRMVEPQESENA